MTDANFVRMNVRAPLQLDVVVVSPGAHEDAIVEATTIDLSAGGAGIVCAEYLPRARRITVGISLDDGSLVTVHATVVSRDRTADRRWRYGVRFVDVEDEQRAVLTRQVMRALAAAFEAARSEA